MAPEKFRVPSTPAADLSCIESASGGDVGLVEHGSFSISKAVGAGERSGGGGGRRGNRPLTTDSLLSFKQ